MKAFIFLTVALFAASAVVLSASVPREDIGTRGLIEDLINGTLNRVLENLTDSIIVDEVVVDFDELESDIITGGFNFTNLRITGISGLVASYIHLDIFTQDISLTLRLSEVIVNLRYWADFTLLQLIPLYGEGRINVVLDDIEISVDGKANLTGGISFNNVVSVLSIGETTFDLNGLINNPEFSSLVSNALNDNFSDFINDNSGVISSLISPIVEAVINAVLSS